MVVRVEHDAGKHINFHEGEHVGIHPYGQKYCEGLTLVVEGKKNGVTVEIEKGSNTRIFLMNDFGKTIENIYV